MTQSITNTSYVFGHSEEEIQRLVRQSRLFNPCTRRFLEQAGISAGMKVLDVGSGPGDAALLLADRVGPGGAVVGVDIDPARLDIARARARATRTSPLLQGISTVSNSTTTSTPSSGASF